MKSFKLIGLTGTTGSGKSEVSRVFAENGFDVIYADELAREIMTNPLVLDLLRDSFGVDVAFEGKLNRQLLADRAFKNSGSKKLLDSITHPFISALFFEKLKKLKERGSSKILFDASQLFESGLDVICDCVISVTADENIRLGRIVERDGLSAEQAKMRMDAQFSEEFFRENSDYIIENNTDLASLSEAAVEIIKNTEVRFGSD